MPAEEIVDRRMTRFVILMGLAGLVCIASAARADDQFECRNAWEYNRADVDGPVLSVKDLGPNRGDAGRYRIVVRDHFTGCRVGDDTNTVCRVGQHASVVGGSFGMWSGDEKDADSDYPYVGHHLWTCQ